jgi:glycerate-2-kinase
LERLKGGGLARAFHGASMITLALSDVVHDAPWDIASGPTVADPTTHADAVRVLDQYHLADARTRAHLRRDDPPTPKHPYLIVSSNRVCVDAACAGLERLGVPVRARRDAFGSTVQEGAQWLISTARNGAGAAVLGGEPVVDVGESIGVGGPSQELALRTALDAQEHFKDWAVLAYSTDGVDGPSPFAGAIVDRATLDLAKTLGVNLVKALDVHGTSAALSAIGAAIPGGASGTNVNHLAVLITR